MSVRTFAINVSDTRQPASTASLWAWTVACAILIAFRIYPGFTPYFVNDSFQYLSMAQNALQGHFGYSSIVHFDAERSFGVVPAPVVTFPMGFPLVIALISRLGVELAVKNLVGLRDPLETTTPWVVLIEIRWPVVRFISANRWGSK